MRPRRASRAASPPRARRTMADHPRVSIPAATAAREGFADGILSPTVVLVEGEGAADRQSLARFKQLLRERPGIAGVVGPRLVPPQLESQGAVLSETGDAARYLLILDDEPSAQPRSRPCPNCARTPPSWALLRVSTPGSAWAATPPWPRRSCRSHRRPGTDHRRRTGRQPAHARPASACSDRPLVPARLERAHVGRLAGTDHVRIQTCSSMTGAPSVCPSLGRCCSWPWARTTTSSVSVRCGTRPEGGPWPRPSEPPCRSPPRRSPRRQSARPQFCSACCGAAAPLPRACLPVERRNPAGRLVVRSLLVPALLTLVGRFGGWPGSRFAQSVPAR